MSILKDLRELARAARKRAEKATSGPWVFINTNTEEVIRNQAGRDILWGHPYEEDAGLDYDGPEIMDFICAARTDVPVLAAGIEKMAAVVEAVSSAPLVERLRTLADWFDVYDADNDTGEHEVQDDLRRWANAIDAALRSLGEK